MKMSSEMTGVQKFTELDRSLVYLTYATNEIVVTHRTV